ncbi:MAG: F-type H+-transporting ATPase subunit epsilon [Psychromonas sp.]|jgi:F-type H+-transporting ATPase subunit epsilon|uniref:F0F1 ATP synthase subunit epsilon n=1 Tax=Psychromonas sp. TaxID=1884585 RepID=UPI0039E3F27A
MAAQMQLKILLPYTTFVDKTDVVRIVAETNQGSFGLLPNRLDCSAALTAGIFCYQCKNGEEVFIAVDQGVLVKTGFDVMVSVRRAIGHADLDQLHALVKKEFLVVDEYEKHMHATMVKLETGFLRQLSNFQHQ